MSVLTITGFAVVLSFVAEAFLSSTTYDMNEAVQFAIFYFLLFWVCVAGVVLASRWSATTIALRMVFAVNLFLAAYAIQVLFAHHPAPGVRNQFRLTGTQQRANADLKFFVARELS
jgi:hypothetical protein